MTHSTIASSDETVVNPTYAAIRGKDTITSTNTARELQINRVHSTVIEKKIMINGDETVINPAYGTISNSNTSSRSNYETIKLQSDSKDITTNGFETTKPLRNTVSVDDTTATRDPTIVNLAYAVVNITDRAIELPINGKENIITSNDETIVNPVYVYAEINDDVTMTETVKLQTSPAYATISDKVIAPSSDEVQRSPCQKITTNSDETVVNPDYAMISNNHALVSSGELQRNLVYSAISESDKNIITSLQPNMCRQALITQSLSNHPNSTSIIIPTDEVTVNATSVYNTHLRHTGRVHTKSKEKDKVDDEQSCTSTSYHTAQPSTHEIPSFSAIATNSNIISSSSNSRNSHDTMQYCARQKINMRMPELSHEVLINIPHNNTPTTAEDTNTQNIAPSSDETIRLQRNPAYAVPSEAHLYEEILHNRAPTQHLMLVTPL